ncbi:hypothetical protein POJ06DRAFT_296914 [Lipomyces tetrasporus]|uniref:Uncharacterized protein n=1 Tax=Lipomyces tetrasporus TaxID=54092 RepID=A0AAD7QLR6_9ASCO|nr:uncharacterized protein POJ06DRAFT_296914 [Lipomyces tetrasporus]KAJ8097670.1 hypothetical protein POJ06DRAFT_296914 [Lipomyces tetrasporus]
MDLMNSRRNRPNYFLLNDGIDEEASSEDRLDSSPNVISLENDILPSESASQTQQVQFEPSAEPQNLSGMVDVRNLNPRSGLRHTSRYPNLKIPGSLKKATRGS